VLPIFFGLTVGIPFILCLAAIVFGMAFGREISVNSAVNEYLCGIYIQQAGKQEHEEGLFYIFDCPLFLAILANFILYIKMRKSIVQKAASEEEEKLAFSIPIFPLSIIL